jgi:Xaa-Pro dipeptidase
MNVSSVRRDFLKAAAVAFAAPFVACSRKSAAEAAERAAREAADAARDLFPELRDERDALEPIRMDERAARRRRLGELLSRAKVDAYVCEHGPTMRYLSGMTWGLSERLFALVVLADGSHFFLSPAFEVDKAKLKIEGDKGPGGEIVAWDEHEYAFAPLAATLRKRRAERVAVDPYLRVFAADGLSGELGAGNVVSGLELRAKLRGVKDEREIALLRKASELTQKALAALAPRLAPDLSGGEISRLIDAALRKTGLVSTWNLSLVGSAAAYPHGGTATQKLEAGEFLLIDCGGEYHEYQSDNTRTWCPVGTPGIEAMKAWHAVRDAQRRAFDVARPGVPCGDIDRAARDTIVRAGFEGDYRAFTHRLGHGIGMEGHEDPYFDSGSKVVLEPGMTLSNEPGIYVLDRYGIRLEDILVITPTGSQCFGTPQSGPNSPV